MKKFSKYYIAYGSNMDVEAMKVRCPNAIVVGKAILEDWKLVFKKHADIVRHAGSKVPVVVWEISERDERSLDYYEGYPYYYDKLNLEITMTDLHGERPKEITALVYVMQDGNRINFPDELYYACIDEGYERFGFDRKPLADALAESIRESWQ